MQGELALFGACRLRFVAFLPLRQIHTQLPKPTQPLFSPPALLGSYSVILALASAQPPIMTTFDTTPEKRATQRAFFKRQLFFTPPPVAHGQVDLTGKTAVVTGSNTGIGLECSRQLLDLGLSKLILAVRSESKGEAAKRELLAGRSSGKHAVEVWNIDLSSYSSITAFVERTKTLERLDIFVHNAGLFKMALEVNKTTGHEETVQVNYLSTALLTILMLPVLKEKNTPQKPGRLVIVSSDTAAWAKFKEKTSKPLLPAFNRPELFDAQDRYYTSKLLGQFFLTELAKRVPSSVAVVNAANPGLCYGSGLNKEGDGTAIGYVFGAFKRIMGRSTIMGGRLITDAAVNHGTESHGQYIEDNKVQP
jgi:NAD(P)-dependent dehydrogenase (short-subunit alcohol dehydrogenase family)